MKGILKYIFSSTYTKIVAIALIAVAVAIVPFVAKASTETQNCDGNSMIWCGATTKSVWDSKYLNGDGHHSPSVIQNDYNITGVGKGDFDASYTVSGVVTKAGNVIVNGKVVATGATSFGRYPLGCQGERHIQDLYERSTECSFRSDALSAFVNMKDGVFQWAVLTSCGNTVHAHPVAPPPSFKCLSLTSDKDHGNPPLKVNFTAKASVQNAKITDYTFYFGDGNHGDVKTDQTTATEAYTYQKVGDFTAYVIVHTDHGSTQEVPNCEVPIHVTTPPPPPTFKCVSLTADKDHGNAPLKVTFVAKASVENAKITSYTFWFGVDQDHKEVQTDKSTATTDYTYQQIGKFTAYVIVHTDHGSTQEVKNCEVPITTTKAPTPIGCITIIKEAFNKDGDELHPTPQFSFTLDGTRTSLNNGGGHARFDNVKPGVHLVTEAEADGWNLILVTPSEPGNPKVAQLTVKDGDKCATATFKNQQILPQTPTPPTPPSTPLPNTGPGDTAAAGLLGSAGLGAAIKGYIRSRKGLLGALLGKK